MSLNSSYSSRIGYKNDLGLSKRPKIFDQWPKKQPSDFHQPYRPPAGIPKLQESRQAEEVLEKSLSLLTNIEQYLKIKDMYEKDINNYKSKSDASLDQINRLTSERGAQYKKQELQRQLIAFNKLIRFGSQQQKKIQLFQMTNLANYDPSHTSVQYTRNYEQAHEQLYNWVNEFKHKRLRLQESLVCYENKMPENKILGDQNNFKQCLRDVKQDMNLTNMADINMLMLFEIADTKEKAKLYTERIISDRRNYAFYESIYDSMTLMDNQYKQMKKDRKWFKTKYSQLTFQNATQIIPQTEESYPLFGQNLKVYDSNMILLARYNAEINLREYGERRKKFVNEVGKYKKQFGSWKDQRYYATQLYSYHCKLINYQKKINLQQKVIGLQMQKRQIHDAYDKCLSLKIPAEMGVIQKYKFRLADEIEKTIKGGGIIVPKRPQIPSPEKKSRFERQDQQKRLKQYLQEGSVLQKYIQFFIKIKYKPDNLKIGKKFKGGNVDNFKQHRPKQEKLQYITQNADTAKSLYFQINQQFKKSNKNEEAQKYRAGLQYVLEINKYMSEIEKENQNDSKQIKIRPKIKLINEYFQNVADKRWQALPIGLQGFLFNFSADLLRKKSTLEYLEDKYYDIIDKNQREIAKQVEKIWPQEKEIAKFQNQYLANEMKKIANAQRTELHHNHFRKLSKYSLAMKRKAIEQFWKINENMICKIFQPYWDKKQIQSIQKSQFFTCYVLTFLTNSSKGKNKKINNISELVLFYLNTVERMEYNNWHQGHIFLQIIKQRLFIRYMQLTLSNLKDFNLTTEIQVMKNILQNFCLIFQIKECVEMVGEQNFQSIFKTGLLIQEQIQAFVPEFTSSSKKQLQEKCNKVLGVIKKTPFVLGTAFAIADFIELLDFSQKQTNLRKCLHNIKTIRNSANFDQLCQLYSQCEKLNKIEHVVLKNEFPPSDVVTIRDKTKRMVYIEALANKVKEQLKGCDAEIQGLLKIYRGHSKDDNDSFRQESSMHGLLHEIRCQLQRLD